MPKVRVDVPESTLVTLLSLSNNRCCVCQTPFVVTHHIDEDPSNNDPDNLAPLCPNCHTQAHSKNNMVRNLTPDRVKTLRDIWYRYCMQRKESDTSEPHAVLKIMSFIRSLEGEGKHNLPSHSWAKTFGIVHPEYAKLTKNEMMQRLFSTSNRTDLVTYLDAVKGMYGRAMKRADVKEKFARVCNAFGIDFNELV